MAADANGHAQLASAWLRAVGSQQPIPPGQVEAEIGVGLIVRDGVVDAVHVGCDDNPAQHAIQTRGQTDVAMVEH